MSFEAFNLGTATILVVVTAIIGFVISCVFAVLWNWFHKRT